ncbi:hypothetical protein DF3PB_2710002 [uncultured Defluviicoccus sp.]|uniref:Uncharacterized protein n=1 Tax=metagenome TaxID=256318 RepID=A0A380TF74_9ZZZZ|nr:hypothetical protein DF3PB_2710002 [uncultured Defluviicoccus sp.]
MLLAVDWAVVPLSAFFTLKEFAGTASPVPVAKRLASSGRALDSLRQLRKEIATPEALSPAR